MGSFVLQECVSPGTWPCPGLYLPFQGEGTGSPAAPQGGVRVASGPHWLREGPLASHLDRGRVSEHAQPREMADAVTQGSGPFAPRRALGSQRDPSASGGHVRQTRPTRTSFPPWGLPVCSCVYTPRRSSSSAECGQLHEHALWEQRAPLKENRPREARAGSWASPWMRNTRPGARMRTNGARPCHAAGGGGARGGNRGGGALLKGRGVSGVTGRSGGEPGRARFQGEDSWVSRKTLRAWYRFPQIRF